MNHCTQCSWTGTNDELRLKTYPNGGDDTVCPECGGRVEEMNGLDSEEYTCMYCQKQFNSTQGTWPQNDFDGNPVFNADLNNRSRDEFVCYDCAE